jgi:hypothetical protein
MNRFYRLMSPAVAFSVVGSLLIVFAPGPGFRLYGGLVTAGVYSLLVQSVLTALLLVGIDDLHGPRRVWGGALLRAADPAYGLNRALAHFYSWRFTPAFLLALGLAESVTTSAIGLLDRPGAPVAQFELLGVGIQRSELLVSALLAAITVFTFRRGVLACLGWCLGFAAGAALTQIAIFPQLRLSALVIVWLAIVLCAVRLGYALLWPVPQQPTGEAPPRRPIEMRYLPAPVDRTPRMKPIDGLGTISRRKDVR